MRRSILLPEDWLKLLMLQRAKASILTNPRPYDPLHSETYQSSCSRTRCPGRYPCPASVAEGGGRGQGRGRPSRALGDGRAGARRRAREKEAAHQGLHACDATSFSRDSAFWRSFLPEVLGEARAHTCTHACTAHAHACNSLGYTPIHPCSRTHEVLVDDARGNPKP